MIGDEEHVLVKRIARDRDARTHGTGGKPEKLARPWGARARQLPKKMRRQAEN
jgi:hypothetical protein